MGLNNNSFSVRYAIVETAQASSQPERFVIGYRSEQSLLEFLVSSCIIATGYCSREDAARACGEDELVALPAAA